MSDTTRDWTFPNLLRALIRGCSSFSVSRLSSLPFSSYPPSPPPPPPPPPPDLTWAIESTRSLQILSTCGKIQSLSIIGINGEQHQVLDGFLQLIASRVAAALPAEAEAERQQHVQSPVRSVTLNGNQFSVQTLYTIIKACHRCESLSLQISPPTTESDDTTSGDVLAATATFLQETPYTAIQHLHIELTSFATQQILLPLLEKCPQLEELVLQGITNETTFEGIVEFLKTRRANKPSMKKGLRRQLKYLEVDIMNCGQRTEQLIEELIRSTGCNTSSVSHSQSTIRSDSATSWVEGEADEIRSKGGCGKGGDDSTLESLAISYLATIGNRCAEALVQHHSETLTKFTNWRPIPLEHFSILVNGLERLQFLKVKVDLDGANAPRRQQRLLPWSCLELRKLDITLSTLLKHSYSHDELEQANEKNMEAWKSSGGWDLFQYQFLQIGRLKQLEVLKLRNTGMIPVNMLSRLQTKYSSFLSHLKWLKRLRELCYRPASGWLDWGEEEARWMMEHWSQLKELEVSARIPERFGETIQDLCPRLHISVNHRSV
ncbi:hypothetical protein BX616_011289 [Lobosporangium transversale]|nr:hypothetical protein BX616_011289 [Lobosporangium transversale]